MARRLSVGLNRTNLRGEDLFDNTNTLSLDAAKLAVTVSSWKKETEKSNGSISLLKLNQKLLAKFL